MTTLLQHIELLNAHADHMMAQEPGLWMSKWTDDISYWNEMGVFAKIFQGLATETTDPTTIMIDATYLKAHRTASSLRGKKRGVGA